MDEIKMDQVNAIMRRAEADMSEIDLTRQDIALVFLHHAIAGLVASAKPGAILKTVEQLIAGYEQAQTQR